MKPFREILDSTAQDPSTNPSRDSNTTCRTSTGELCSLCHAARLSYAQELVVKNRALQQFWSETLSSPPLKPLVPSPIGRGYRTVTKRKAFHTPSGVRLGLVDPERESAHGRVEVLQCAIEPDDHASIYHHAQRALLHPSANALAESLQYVIIKGTLEEYFVLFSVTRAGPAVQKACTTVSKVLTKHVGRIVGVYFYVDETKGRYYLGVKDPENPGRLQRIYGKKTLQLRVGGKNFLFPPLAFSQINQSLLSILTEMAGTLLSPDPRGTLYDLYCGYGLFALTFAGRVRRTIGADIAPSSIEAAHANASRLGITNSRFLRSNLNAPSVAELVRDMSPNDIALLDPPRKGTLPGVIETVASRRPKRILHIFCNIDLLPQEVSQWTLAGYTVKDAVPLDMFPGTSSVEVLVLLTPS